MLLDASSAHARRPHDVTRRRPVPMAARALLALSVLLLGACASDAITTGEEELSSARWSLPADVAQIGARVRVAYEGAPRWEGPSTCGGRLSEGARELGTYLRDKFEVVASVGGYACRPNTANASRMSVHATGRALDVFVPTRSGRADAAAGDPVANWLVVNAARIGVQLVIWNHTIWRANGTNTSRYGGPNPHVDHLHVEITTRAGSAQTPWFKDPEGAESPGTSSPGGDGADPDAPDLEPGETDSLGTPSGRRSTDFEASDGCTVAIVTGDSSGGSPRAGLLVLLAVGAVGVRRRQSARRT